MKREAGSRLATIQRTAMHSGGCKALDPRISMVATPLDNEQQRDVILKAVWNPFEPRQVAISPLTIQVNHSNPRYSPPSLFPVEKIANVEK